MPQRRKKKRGHFFGGIEDGKFPPASRSKAAKLTQRLCAKLASSFVSCKFILIREAAVRHAVVLSHFSADVLLAN